MLTLQFSLVKGISVDFLRVKDGAIATVSMDDYGKPYSSDIMVNSISIFV